MQQPPASILSHNWTGRLAAYAPLPARPLGLAQPVKGVSSARAPAGGTWLKAHAAGRLRLHSDQQGLCQLELHLEQHLLLRCALCELRRLALLATSRGSVLVLLVRDPPGQRAPPSMAYCFCFYDELDCSSFCAALHAMTAAAAGAAQQVPAAALPPDGPGAAAAAAAEQAKAAIKQYLLDPAFHAYVDTVEQLWDEVEQELEQQGLLA